VVNAVGNVVDRNNGELVPTPVAAPPPAEASASSGGSSGVLSPNAFVQGAKDRVKQKFWAGLEELPGAVGTVFAAVHLYVNPEEKAAELSHPAEVPALDPISQFLSAARVGLALVSPDKETRSRAAGALAVDLAQQLFGAVILGAAGKSSSGRAPSESTVGEPVRAGDTGTYRQLRGQRSAFGEAEPLDMDHQPSYAAQRAAAERSLGRPLTPEEARALRGDAPAIASPRDVHRQTSPTYGGRNTPERVAEDSVDLKKAQARDRAIFRKAMKNR